MIISNVKSYITLIATCCMLFSHVNAQQFSNQKASEGSEIFGSWGKSCESDPNDATSEACFISQTMILQEKNVEVLYIAIGKLPKVPEPVLAITTPLRTFLPAGIRIQVDGNDAQTLPHEFCDKIGCHLRVGVKEEMINSMKAGNNINIEFRDAVGQKLAIPVSLNGFTKGFNSL